MSEGKLAAQVAHVCILLRESYPEVEWDKRIVVLKASDKKFWDTVQEHSSTEDYSALQTDWGLTELKEKTVTTFAYYDN